MPCFLILSFNSTVILIIVPLWVYDSDCVIKDFLENPSLITSSLSLYPTLSSDNNQIHLEGTEERHLDAVEGKAKNNKEASLNKNVHINVTSIAYFPHNDTLIATYKCVLKGNKENTIWSQTKEKTHFSTCSFAKQNVSFGNIRNYNANHIFFILMYKVKIININFIANCIAAGIKRKRFY